MLLMLVLFLFQTVLLIFQARYWELMAVLPFRINNRMILNLNKQAQDAFAAVDALGNTLKYGELLDFPRIYLPFFPVVPYYSY